MGTVTDAEVRAIPGWMDPLDLDLFRLLLSATGERLGGDLAEMGVFQGLSATLMGSYLADGEVFTVVDLFGSDAGDDANQNENDDQYDGLSVESFKRNYLRHHDTLPTVIVGYSSAIVDVAAHGTHRFVHVDASHLFEHVAGDAEVAHKLLKADGVVVFDDYRSLHTPGTAAAVWQAVGAGLRPFAVSENKLYGTWGDPAPWREVVAAFAGARADLLVDPQLISGTEVLRLERLSRGPVDFVPPIAVPAAMRLQKRLLGLRSKLPV